MNNQTEPKLVKWPFYVFDIVLVAVAYLIYFQSKSPRGPWGIILCIVAIGMGALMGIAPFLLEYWATVKLAETAGLATSVELLQNLDRVAGHINGATAQWQRVQEESTK